MGDILRKLWKIRVISEIRGVFCSEY